MSNLIPGMPMDSVITVNRIILKEEYGLDELEERVAQLCENVKTYHSDTGFLGGFVCVNSGNVSNEGSTSGQLTVSDLQGKEILLVTFWNSFEDHELSHRSDTFQPLFLNVLELCENGNEEIAYNLLWSGRSYNKQEVKAAREAKMRFAS